MLYLLALASVTMTMLFGASGSCTGSPADDLRRAESLIQAGDCDGALKVLDDVSDADSLPRALQMMANCHKRLGRWSDAVSSYERLLSIPDSPIPAIDVNICLMDCHMANGDQDKADSIMRELVSKYPRDAWRVCFTAGKRLFWQHKYSEAIIELRKSVELGAGHRDNPEFTDARSYLINSYIGARQWEHALELAEILMRECPSRAWEWSYAVGRCYQGQGKHQQAVTELKKAFDTRKGTKSEETRLLGKTLLECCLSAADLQSMEPVVSALQADYPDSEPSWQHVLGRMYMAQDAYDKAASCFGRAAQTSKLRWEARSALIYQGQCLYRLGRGKEAVPAIEDYYAKHPDMRADELLARGAVLYHGAKDYDGAVDVLQQLIAEFGTKPDPSTVELIDTANELIVDSLELGRRWAEAAYFLESIASSAENQGIVWCRVGDDYVRAAMHREALKAYRRAMDGRDLDRSLRARAMYQQALCYKSMGYDNSAQRIASRVAELYPDTESAKEARGVLIVWSGARDVEINLGP